MVKPECKEDYENKRLEMSDEKCDPCPYKYQCLYMAIAMDEIVNGDDDY